MKQAFAQFSRRAINSIFVLSLREAFISLLPYIIVSAIFSLSLAFIDVFSLLPQGSDLYQGIDFASQALRTLLPLAIVIAISYYISQNIGVNTLEGSVLAAICFVTNSGYLVRAPDGIFIDIHGAAAYPILMPVVTTYCLGYLGRLKLFRLVESRYVSIFLVKHINLILPFFLTFFAVWMLSPLVADGITWFVRLFIVAMEGESIEGACLKWIVLTHFFWLLGIHGPHLVNSTVDTTFAQQELLPGITSENFINTFIFLGGSGTIWGFVIATFLVSRDQHLRQIAKLSLPFSTFNISEIIMYGIPIVLNPYFVIPFMLCPVLNFLLAYAAIHAGLVPVISAPLSWMTPALASGYIVGGGSFITVIFQLFLMALSAAVYLPFVRMYSSTNNEQVMFEKLSDKLSVNSSIEVQTEKRYIFEQDKRLEAHQELKKVIDEITEGELLLYYQPKMNLKGQCHGFEALLRLRQRNGNIVGPYFLNNLEAAGFSDAIDWWLTDKLVDDLQIWKAQGFAPRVSFNLNPSVLTDAALINKLIENFSSYEGQVEIEILETAYIRNFMMIRENIAKLKKHGIGTAIDDFGTGFSSLSYLYKLNADTIKLDKSILNNAESDKGRVLYSQLCSLCKKLGFKLVAEGVERRVQEKFVMQAGVDFMQGWLYAPALPMNRALEFALGTGAARKTVKKRAKRPATAAKRAK
jgi:cellobiose-specific phosphotransferase system component IIC/EAL domain-containing protein (putative c-di-GMP-specific phosphodiesterase class I)